MQNEHEKPEATKKQAVELAGLLGGDVLIFLNTQSHTQNRRYWAIGQYRDNGLWMFYWHEGNDSWVTYLSVDAEFAGATKADPRARILTEEEVPQMFFAWSNPGERFVAA